MRRIDVNDICQAVAKLCIEANTDLTEDVQNDLIKHEQSETSVFGKYILQQIIENANLAREKKQAMCQDTGIAIVFVEIGQSVQLVGGSIHQAIHDGVAKGYTDGYLRASMVDEPVFERINTKNNTPAMVHIDLVEGDFCKITVMPKGGGAENMASVAMLMPTAGVQAVEDYVVESVLKAGGNPCPPIVVGVGIGGSFERVAMLAKRALLRPNGDRHQDFRYAQMEDRLLERINKTGIGPQGLGGNTTALDVRIETSATHIAMLPVAVNINCHAARHRFVVL